MVLAPIVRGRKGEFKKRDGNAPEARPTPGAGRRGSWVNLDDEINLDKRKNHTIESRCRPSAGEAGGLSIAGNCRSGLGNEAGGWAVQVAVVGGDEQLYSEKLAVSGLRQ